jgi:hypothetical protein
MPRGCSRRKRNSKRYATSHAVLISLREPSWRHPPRRNLTCRFIPTRSRAGGRTGAWATVNLNNNNPTHSGSASASVAADAYEAIYLHHDAMTTSGFTDLAFWIHGGSSGGQLLQVQGLLNGAAQTAVALPALSANVWQQFIISLASLGVANKSNFDGFWIQDRSGPNAPDVLSR